MRPGPRRRGSMGGMVMFVAAAIVAGCSANPPERLDSADATATSGPILDSSLGGGGCYALDDLWVSEEILELNRAAERGGASIDVMHASVGAIDGSEYVLRLSSGSDRVGLWWHAELLSDGIEASDDIPEALFYFDAGAAPTSDLLAALAVTARGTTLLVAMEIPSGLRSPGGEGVSAVEAATGDREGRQTALRQLPSSNWRELASPEADEVAKLPVLWSTELNASDARELQGCAVVASS